MHTEIDSTFQSCCFIQSKPDTPLELRNLIHQDPIGGEVKVKMITSGLCGAQVNEISGLKGVDKYVPHLMGHEGFGEVVSVGDQVAKVKPGDYVIFALESFCWNGYSRNKFKEIDGSEIGAGPVTTFQSSQLLLKIDVQIPYDEDLLHVLPLLGCAL